MRIANVDEFLLSAYTGQGGFQTGDYLIKHPRESQEKLGRRKELATYPNYTRKIVNAYLNHLFQRPARRESQLDIWQTFATNADGAGNAIEKVMRRATRLAMLLGTVALVVDRPQGKPQNAADEKRLLPYVSIRMPASISRVALNEFGDLASITFSEARNVVTDGASEIKILYRTYRADGWMLAEDADGAWIVDQGTYDLGGVPVALLHSTEVLTPNTWRAQSWAWDVAADNFNLYNLYSELREILRSQTFSLLTFPISDMTEAQALKDLSVSTENALVYNPQGGGAPAFISPAGENATIYQAEIVATINRLYQAANLEFVGGSSDNSGVALAFRFEECNRTIAGLADLVEQAEREVANYAARWSGVEFDGTITYARDFSILDLQQELKNAMDVLTLSISDTFDKALKKRLARSILGMGADADLLQAIDQEIDAGTDPYGERIAQEAPMPNDPNLSRLLQQMGAQVTEEAS